MIEFPKFFKNFKFDKNSRKALKRWRFSKWIKNWKKDRELEPEIRKISDIFPKDMKLLKELKMYLWFLSSAPSRRLIFWKTMKFQP